MDDPADRAVLVTPDSFKGTFTAAEVAAAIGRGLTRTGEPAPDLCPVADGGEGTMAVLRDALGGRVETVRVADPLGRPVDAAFALLADCGSAVVEVAQGSGLHLVAPHERDAYAASSVGTGELVAAAVEAGARRVLVAAGGSATTDGGAGAVAAIRAAGGLRGARLVVLCDVRTVFEDAPAVFAPQKGADPATVLRLRTRLEGLAAGWERDPRGVPMTGAAGGLAGGLWAALGAELAPGAPYVLDRLGIDRRMRAARAVIVGEGRIDGQTLVGKIVGELAMRARGAGRPCAAVVGQNALSEGERSALGLSKVLEASTLEEIEAAGARLALPR